MSLKITVDNFLVQNFERLQEERQKPGFSWKPSVAEINKHLVDQLDPEKESDRDYVRNRFLALRKTGKNYITQNTSLVIKNTTPKVLIEVKPIDTYNTPKVKPKNDEEEFKLWKQEKVRLQNQVGLHVVAGCIHFPAVNTKFYAGFLKFLEDNKDQIKGIHLIGDILDCKSLSTHDKGQVSDTTLEKEYSTSNIYLDKLDSVLAKGIEKNYIWGNHEERYTRLLKQVDTAKFGKALLSPTAGCRFKERGYTIQEDYLNAKIQLGKYLDLIHGQFITANATKKHLDAYKKSIMFAHCFSEDTEVLTSSGWKRFYQLDLQKDTVGTVNLSTGEGEYNYIESYHEYDSYNELIHFTGYGMDLQVTDGHAMVCYKGKNLVRVEAKNLLGKEFKVPSGAINTNKDYTLSDDQIRLLGWIVTDGHYCKGRDGKKSYLRIKQCNKPKVGVKHITDILDSLGETYSVSQSFSKNYECGDIYVHTSKSIDYLIDLVPDKKLCWWMKMLSKRQFDILLHEIILGDGTFYGANSMQYVTGNESDIDIMQALCVLNGYRTSVTYRKTYWTMSINTRLTSRIQAQNSKVVPYHGKVYCVSVKNQTLIVRRNGQTAVCGNTHKMGSYFDTDKAAFNIGWMGDKEHKAFGYCSRVTKEGWQNGFSIVNIDSAGFYHVQMIQWYNDRFYFGGKEYRA